MLNTKKGFGNGLCFTIVDISTDQHAYAADETEDWLHLKRWSDTSYILLTQTPVHLYHQTNYILWNTNTTCFEQIHL